MPGQPGLPNLTAMRGRRKGGAPKPQTAPPIGMAAHAAAFLETLAARHYSTASIDAHRWALRQFTGWAASCGAPDPSSYKRADLEDYQLFLHRYRSPRGGHALAINTQLARIGCLRRFFAWLCRAGVITANPAADLDLPRKQARLLPKALSAEEIRLLLAVPDTADPFGLRDRAILELFYATGIRRTELANLDLGDFDPCDQTLHIRRGKGGKSRMLPVGQRAATWLGCYLGDSRPRFDHLPGETAMFLSGYGTRITPVYLGNWIKKLMKRCGIDKPGACHLFRHSCATDMHRGGADIRYVQEMLGHARLETTQIYTHVHIDALRAVHARTHPHGTADIGGSSEIGVEITATSDNEGDFASNSYVGSLCASTSMSALAHPSPTTAAVTVARGQSGSPKPPGEEPPPGNALPRTPNPPKDPAGGNSHNPLMSSGLDEMESLSNSASLVDYGYRYYDPVTGRWPSRDPIVEHAFLLNQSKNLRISRKVIMRVKFSNYFAFLTNNPLNSSDFLGLSDKIREPKKGCKIEIRCGPVAAAANTMYHCGVVVNGVEYGIGGDAGVPNRPNGKGKADGATVFGEGGGIPGEYANPAEDKAPKGHKTYKGSCECDCTYVELCMKFHQNNTIPRPYSAWSGPNSNTYAHQLLNVCRCQMDTWMDSNFLTWNSPNKTPNWNHPVSNDYPAYPSDDTFD